MLIMETYLFCASVRFGVLLISAFALVKCILLMYMLTTYGTGYLLSMIARFESNLNYRTSYYLVRDAIYWLEKYPRTALLFFQLLGVFHSMSCVLAAYGAFRLKKLYVLPLAFFEFSYIVQIIILSILILRIIRHFVDLTHLILITLLSTAYAMLVTYDFLALVAFEQIVRLVMSKRYQQLYGPDPFNPRLNSQPFDVATNEDDQQLQKQPIIIYVMPKVNNMNRPKWWHVEHLDDSLLKVKEGNRNNEVNNLFLQEELISEVLRQNANKIEDNKIVKLKANEN